MAMELVGREENLSLSRFLSMFMDNVYRSKHLARKNGAWVTVDSYLKTDVVDSSFSSDDRTVGFFSRIQTRLVCFDIDAHDCPVDQALAKSEKKLKSLVSLLGAFPNAIERTTRGMHCFYFLSDWVNSRRMTEGLNAVLSARRLDVEVRGTWNEGLSFPLAKNLSIDNLEEIPSTVFSSLFPELKAKQATRKDVVTFSPGNTNEALCQAVPFMRSGLGLSVAETVKRISSSLPVEYRGELRNERRLTQRVRSFKVVNAPKKLKLPPSAVGLDETISEILGKAGSKGFIVSKRRLPELKKVVECLILAKATFEDSCSSKEGELYRNALNPFSSYYKRLGATPVPSSLLQKVNTHYGWYLKFLLDVGFLSLPTGRHYDVNKHVCIHYVIGFLKKAKEETTEMVSLAIKALGTGIDYVLNCLSVPASDSAPKRYNPRRLC